MAFCKNAVFSYLHHFMTGGILIQASAAHGSGCASVISESNAMDNSACR